MKAVRVPVHHIGGKHGALGAIRICWRRRSPTESAGISTRPPARRRTIPSVTWTMPSKASSGECPARRATACNLTATPRALCVPQKMCLSSRMDSPSRPGLRPTTTHGTGCRSRTRMPDDQIGFFFGIDAFGHPGFNVAVNGIWRQLTSKPTTAYQALFAHYRDLRSPTGMAIYVNGKPAGSLNAPGRFFASRRTDLIVEEYATRNSPTPPGSMPFRDPVNYSFDGYLDRPRDYRRGA